MSVDREQLNSFLLENGKDRSMIEAAIKLMEPVFVIAERGQWPSAEFKDEDVSHAIAQATGKEVKKVVFVSKHQPFPKPEWMTQMVCRTSLRNGGGQSLGASLTTSLWNSLGQILLDTLGTSLRDGLRDGLRDSLGASLREILWTSLFFYLGFTLAGDREKAGQLTPLIELFPYGSPLGEKKDEPGTWLVLCA